MMKINYKIRKAVPEDAREFVTFKNFVWREAYKDILPETVFIAQEEKTEKKVNGFAEHFCNCNDNICYVAEFKDKIIGIMAGKIRSSYPYFEEANYADLSMLYIHPEFQNIGIGTKFKDIFVEWAKSNGAKQFVIGVFKENSAARRVYESWGGKLEPNHYNRQELGKECEEVFYTYKI